MGVDEMVPDREAVLSAAHTAASGLAKIPGEARHHSKMLMRQPTIEKLTKDKQSDIDYFCKFINNQVRKLINIKFNIKGYSLHNAAAAAAGARDVTNCTID